MPLNIPPESKDAIGDLAWRTVSLMKEAALQPDATDDKVSGLGRDFLRKNLVKEASPEIIYNMAVEHFLFAVMDSLRKFAALMEKQKSN